jgi:hypothetical protein
MTDVSPADRDDAALLAFSLAQHTGPIVLTQRAADGRALGSERLRK